MLSRLGDLVHGESGVAAVEFAAVVPFMLLAYLGSVELGTGVAINRKVAVTTRAVADLATRYTTIKNADMAGILGSAGAIMAPYDPTRLAVTVSEITVDAKGNASVAWSDTQGGSARATGSPMTLPATLQTPGVSYILGEVQYDYKPAIGYVLSGTVPLSNHIFMSPRESGSITRAP